MAGCSCSCSIKALMWWCWAVHAVRLQQGVLGRCSPGCSFSFLRALTCTATDYLRHVPWSVRHVGQQHFQGAPSQEGGDLLTRACQLSLALNFPSPC